MIRRIITALLLAVVLTSSTGFAATHHANPTTGGAQLAQFDTEGAAQAHCPRDTVVWLNTTSGIYQEKSIRWYGRTKHHAYVCRKEADAAGDRNTRDGQ